MHDSKTVYHYTSPEALLSIIKKQTLWFTDSQYLNDKSELMTVLDAAYQANKQLRSGKSHKLHDEVDKFIEDISRSGNLYEDDSNILCEGYAVKDTKIRYYVLCTSEDHDTSSMWSSYVKNEKYYGYNLGINVGAIKDLFKQRINIRHEKMIYDKSQQTKEFYDFIGKYIENIIDTDNTELTSLGLLGKLRVFIDEKKLFYKASAFESEKEHRFVLELSDVKEEDSPIMYDNSLNPTISKKFRIGNSGIITPYVEWKFGALVPNLINQITLSPMMEKDLAEKGLMDFLKECNLQHIQITPSTINLRY